ncbi:MAG: hypothetical protein IKZ02_00085 [Alphaproteobacteria bacterium]|nr:hypothetical protein [Alphaproteobacteria bacterium]
MSITDNEILKLNEQERQPVECWTRVMGYFRPYSQFNKGKKSEFNDRKWFLEDNCSCRIEMGQAA